MPLKWADRGLRSTAIILAPLSKVDPAKFWSLLTPVIQHIQLGWYIPAVLVLSPLTTGLRRKADNVRLDDVHSLLDQLRDHTFKNETYDLEQYRRVTLFRRRRVYWRWPYFGGWLIPIERSGTSTRRTKAVFLAPDDGEKCEGVVGRTWGKGKGHTLSIANLPDLMKDASDEKVAQYAKQSFITEKKVREYLSSKRTPPRSLLGFPVEVNGKQWGVIVFDSAHETIKVKAATDIFKKLNPTLTGYLKGL